MPVIVDETGEIIDGRLRVELCDELSLPWRPTAMTEAGLTADEKTALRIKLNFLRRNTPPTGKQKRKFLDVILKAEPHLSNGAIAQLCGLDDSTVSKKRKKLVEAGEVSAASVVTGVDGVPRRKPQRTKPTSIPEGAPSIKLATVDDCSTADDAATACAVRLPGVFHGQPQACGSVPGRRRPVGMACPGRAGEQLHRDVPTS